MKQIAVTIICTLILSAVGSFCSANTSGIEGVFGLDTVGPQTSFAVWIPIDEGGSIEGVRWYNNDSQVVFPEFLVVAGDVQRPDFLNHAIPVGESVLGYSLDWSELRFEHPIASETSGIYLIIRLPEGGIREGRGYGGGAGVGYIVSDGIRRSWLTGDGVNWHPLSPAFTLAVEAIPGTDKAGNALVLAKPKALLQDPRTNEKTRPSQTELIAVPNPFNPQTEIRFTMAATGVVELVVYDIRGRVVRSLVKQRFEAGDHSVVWDGKSDGGQGVASGVYFAKLNTSGASFSTRLVLLK